MKPFGLWATAGVAALVISAPVYALGIGDPAPALKVKAFVKGKPVAKLLPGKIYVVEFWATWCGPCKTSIPHLTAMQKQNPAVTFIGVSINDDQAKVAPFVKEMGNKMNYTVAMDTVAQNGFMAKNWMDAAKQNGIPTAFIVDKKGKIAWIGHPSAMESPLQQVIAGKWDYAKAKKEIADKQAAQEKMMALQQSLGEAMRADDMTKALSLIDKASEGDVALEDMLVNLKIQVLKRAGREDDALAYAEKCVARWEDPMPLNALAWNIVDPDSKTKPSAAWVQLALKAAEKGFQLTGEKDAMILDTLAWSHFAAGNKEKALELEEKAVKLDGGKNPDIAAGLKRMKGE